MASGAGGSSPVSTTADSYSWIGSSGGSWGVASDWEDVTSDQDPAAAVPGAGDAVTISGPTGSIYEVISGGGTAASVSVSGLLDLIGTYSTGALGVGSVQVGATAVTATSGSLTLGAGTSAQVQASTVTVADGTLAVSGGGVTLSASGAVTVGTAGGYLTSSYSSFFSGAASTLSVAGGATATAASDVTVADGTLTAQGTGTSLTIGGNLVLGTPIPSATEPPYLSGASGSLSVSGGAKVAIAGAITDAYPSYSFTNSAISVSGQGSSLTAGGTLTLDALRGDWVPASASGGGVLRVGGLTLVDTSYLSYYEPSLSVDSTSSVEIGTAGAGAAGAITVDTGVTVAMTVPPV